MVMLVLLITIGLNFYLFVIIPKGFLPDEDTGEMFGKIVADQSISFQLMEKKFEQFVTTIAHDPAVQNVTGFTGGGSGGGPGGSAVNSGSVFVQLKPIDQRRVTTDQAIARLSKKLNRLAGADLRLQNAGSFRVGGRQAARLSIHARSGHARRTTGMAAAHHSGASKRARTFRRELRRGSGRAGGQSDNRQGDGRAAGPDRIAD